MRNGKLTYERTTAFKKCKCLFLWCIYNRQFIRLCLSWAAVKATVRNKVRNAGRSNTFYQTS